MKNKEKVLIVFLIIMIFLVLSSTFLFNYKLIINIWFLFFLLIGLTIVYCINGYEKDKNINKIDICQIVFIYSFLYLLIIYLSGIMLGFVRNPYSLEIVKILKNIVPVCILIVLEELFKYIVLKKSSHNKIIVFLLVILFVAIDICLNIYAYDLKKPMDIFQVISSVVLKSVTKNILLVYIIIKSGYLPAILYRFIFELYPYLVPIEPDLGIYLTGVFDIVLPTILFLRLNTLFSKKKKIVKKGKKFISFIITTPIVTLLIIIVSLISNLFAYTAYAIGSDSMKQIISTGDVVIIKKIDKEKIDELKLNDIIAYNHDSMTIVHRIINIRNNGTELIYNTKGDNNEAVDNWNVKVEDVKGKVEVVVPWIGYPTVWLTKQMK